MEALKESYHLQSEQGLSGQFQIADYLKGLHLESALVGGFSKESVYFEMKKLSSLFQKQMEALDAQRKQAELDAEALQAELVEARREIMSIKAVLDTERQNKTAYEDQLSILEHAVKAVRQTEEDAKNAAAGQAAYIIETAKSEAERILQENHSAIQKTASQREALGKAVGELGKLLETLHACAFMTYTEVEKQQKLFASIKAEGNEDLFRKGGTNYIASVPYASSQV